MALLRRFGKHCGVSTLCGFWDAEVNGDDVLLGNGQTLHFLRQQNPPIGKDYTLCLSDFVKKGLGAFATSVDAECAKCDSHDSYETMLRQTLCDRFAEAAAEKLQKDILKIEGIRPAVGYPSLPDQSFIFELDRLLHLNTIGITLTESGAMSPHASVCGLMISHPKASYFSIGKIDHEQLTDYARRKAKPIETHKKYHKRNKQTEQLQTN